MTLLFPLALAISFNTKFEGGSLGYGLPMSGGDMVSEQLSFSIHQDRAARQVFPMVLDSAGMGAVVQPRVRLIFDFRDCGTRRERLRGSERLIPRVVSVDARRPRSVPAGD